MRGTLLTLIAIALVLGLIRLAAHRPPLIREDAPGIAAISGTGSIIHILDWHYVPRELLAPNELCGLCS